MNIIKKCLAMTVALMLLWVIMLPTTASADYYYTVRILPGNIGYFNTTRKPEEIVEVDGTAATVNLRENEIVITGLSLDDRVNININDSDNMVLSEKKYYAKIVRPAGNDNSTAVEGTENSMASFKVAGDTDLVVGYGIRGDVVSYTVTYTDTDGKVLHAPDVYYGNVGDKPVIAYRYIDGYTPNYSNITKTLNPDPTENILPFTYTAIPTPTPTPTPTPGGGGAGGGGAAGGGAAAAEGETTEPTETTEVTVPVETTEPTAPQEILDLDETNPPLAGGETEPMPVDSGRKVPLVLILGGGIGIIALLALIGLIITNKRKDNDDGTEDHEIRL